MAIRDEQINNGVFRVTKWTIRPNDEIPRHVHEFEYVVVPLVNGTMRVLNPDGSETRAKIQVGQSYTRQAGADHTIVNGGSETIEFIEIEKLL